MTPAVQALIDRIAAGTVTPSNARSAIDAAGGAEFVALAAIRELADGGGIAIGTTPIAGGTDGLILKNNAGVVGEILATNAPTALTPAGTLAAYDAGGHLHARQNAIVENDTHAMQVSPTSLLSTNGVSDNTTLNLLPNGTVRNYAMPDAAGTGKLIGSLDEGTVTPTMLTPGIARQCGVNVKEFGAVGDARKVTDGVTVDGTNTVTSATAAFTAADVGKVIWGTLTDGASVITPRTIATVVSATEITVSGATLAGWNGVWLVIGTDDTAAIQAAVAAVEALPNRGNIYIPSGGYITTDTPFVFTAAPVGFTLPSIVGESSASTTFFPSPTSTLNSAAFIFNADVLNGRKHMQGFTVDGTNGTFSGKHVVYFSSSANGNTMEDVRVVNFTSVFAGINNGGGTLFRRCHIEGIWGGRGIYNNGSLTFIDSYSGNCGYFSIDCANAGLFVVRGTLDESNAGTVNLLNTTARFDGALVYAGASYTACVVDGTSIVRAVDTRFMPFDSNNNCTGLSLASGGKAYLLQCTLTGSGTGYGLNNEGTVYDGGNNVSNTKTGGGSIDATLAL